MRKRQLLLMIAAAMLGGVSVSAAADAQSSSSVELTIAIHFIAPDGKPVLAAPDEYLVEKTPEAQLKIVPRKGGAPLIISADKVTHDIDLSAPIPLLLDSSDDVRTMVLLVPDGTALEATGSLSGMHSRGIVRPRRHYQLAYQLDPATGQLQFGDGTAGQRPTAGSANVSSNYRVGAGALGSVNSPVSRDNELEMIALQSLLSQRAMAVALASNMLAAMNEPFHLEYNTDRPGGDYGQRATVSPAACRSICSADGACQAFTFGKPLSPAANGQCFLKRTVPAPVASGCCISAKRKSAQQGIIGNMGR